MPHLVIQYADGVRTVQFRRNKEWLAWYYVPGSKRIEGYGKTEQQALAHLAQKRLEARS